MKVRVNLVMDFDIGEGDPDEPEQTFEQRQEGGWYEELQSKIEGHLFNFGYASLIEHKWMAEQIK